MSVQSKSVAEELALAFLRKRAARKFEPICRRTEVRDSKWIFDYFHPKWREFRKKGLPYGYRIAVGKASGRAEHFATLQKKESIQLQNQRPGWRPAAANRNR